MEDGETVDVSIECEEFTKKRVLTDGNSDAYKGLELSDGGSVEEAMEDGETVDVSIESEEFTKETVSTDRNSDAYKGLELSDEGSVECNNAESSQDILMTEFGFIKPVDSRIEIESLGHQNRGSQYSDENQSIGLNDCQNLEGTDSQDLGENSEYFRLIQSNVSNLNETSSNNLSEYPKNFGSVESEVVEDPDGTSSNCLSGNSDIVFNVCDEDNAESTSLLSFDQDDLSVLDHPLRSLSCIQIQDNRSSSINIPAVTTISNPRRNGVRSECIPLRNLFRSDEGSSEHRWVDSIGYKNWLLHLARRRRCEILILIGFLMWLIFFIALAIALNGKGKLLDEENENANIGDGSFNNSSNRNAKNHGTVTVGHLKTQETPRIASPTLNLATSHAVLLTEATFADTNQNQEDRVDATSQPGLQISTDEPIGKFSSVVPTTAQSSMTTAARRPNSMQELAVHFNSIVPTLPSSSMTTQFSSDTANISIKEGRTTSSSVVRDATNMLHNRKEQTHADVSDPELLANNAIKEVTPTVSFETTQSDVVEFDGQVMTRLVELSKIVDTGDNNSSNYLIGVGRADITGPAADVNMMGYANPKQVSGGIHLRQYSRAFIIEDPKTSIRTVFVNIDACMASHLLKLEVMNALKKEFGDIYRAENLCITGTHTHSGPAGFLQDVLFQITSWGYVDETLAAMSTGIVDSIRIAHDSIQPGDILLNKGQLVGSNINRSPTAYENNPAEEKAKYKYNVDTEMILLKFIDQNNNGIGMINWFPVHCTSMNNTNNLISSDNKGYAEILFENFMDPNSRPGESNFVAAFAQSNEGDVSPNTNGPHCTDTGDPCDNIHSTCNGKSQYCVASGPGKDMFESTKIIGQNQFEKAKELFLSASRKLIGPVKFIHEYVNMTNYEVVLQNMTKVKTCKPAMGFSFAAGTTDGPGAFDFKQGDRSGNQFWNLITSFLHAPSKEQTDCHFPKPILLDTGEMVSPYEWQPEIVESQLLQIGQFIIAALPGEFTTMAGRRLREGIIEVLKSHDSDTKFEVTLAGLANSYSDYITTHEEYLVQRYEGASTIYGPYTSEAHTQQFKKLARYLSQNKNISSEVKPVDVNKDKLMSLQTSVIFDGSPFYKSIGDISSDVKDSYIAGEEVTVTFVAGNPRNCLVAGVKNMTFLTVEKELNDGTWKIIFTDADWDTKFTWVRTSTMRGLSDAIISWQTHKNTPPGKYRIHHHGFSKAFFSGVSPYSGTSSVFTITSS